MDSKKILILLVALLVFINVYLPLDEQNEELAQNIVTTKKLIEKDRYYLKHQKRFVSALNQSMAVNNSYYKMLFFHEESSQVLNKMQKKIKGMISYAHVHEDYIKWGEKYNDEKFQIVPMQVRVSGAIKNIGLFFEKLYMFRQIKIKEFSITRTQQYYILKVSIFGVIESDML